MNVPNHPHRHSNWLGTIQRYAKNGDIHRVMSRIVNAHMNRTVERSPSSIDDDRDHARIYAVSPIITTDVTTVTEVEPEPTIGRISHSILQPLYEEDDNDNQYNYEDEEDDEQYQYDDDDEDANQNLPEEIESLFRFDNFYDHIMQGIDQRRMSC